MVIETRGRRGIPLYAGLPPVSWHQASRCCNEHPNWKAEVGRAWNEITRRLDICFIVPNGC